MNKPMNRDETVMLKTLMAITMILLSVISISVLNVYANNTSINTNYYINNDIPIYYVGSDPSIKSLFKNVVDKVNEAGNYIVLIDLRTTTLTKVGELIHDDIIKRGSTPVIIIGGIDDVHSVMKMIGSRMYGVPVAVKTEADGESSIIRLDTIVYGYVPTGDDAGKMFSVNGLKTTLKDSLVSTYLDMEEYIKTSETR